jgi:hypothetical protein
MPDVGEVVRLGNSIGRVCCINAFQLTACVQFPGQCLTVALDALEHADGNAPDCSDACFNGCSGA